MNKSLLAYLLSLVAVLGMATSLSAQNLNDALRYSTFSYDATARAAGVGGTLGALGSDFSVLSSNPAGLGWYRRSEFTFTPNLLNNYSEANLTGNPTVSDRRMRFNLGNIGFVAASSPKYSYRWRTSNFGIGFNRIANFNQRIKYDGRTVGSIVDRFQENANGRDFIDDFEEGLAIDTEALFFDEAAGRYFSDFEFAPDALVRREQTVSNTGSINEFVLAWAGNYDDKLLIGATMGVPFLRFNQEKRYTEQDTDNEVDFFNSLSFDENLRTTGLGINLKLGLIYRVSQSLRVGVAAHTPTAYALNDTFTNSMSYSFTEDGTTFNNQRDSPAGTFAYSLRTPWRLLGNAGLIIGQRGFISGEVEWVNYARNRFRYADFPEDAEATNAIVSASLQSALNFRAGGELRLGDYYMLRAGLGLLGSPMASEDSYAKLFSLGAGMVRPMRSNYEEDFARTRTFSLNMAYRFTRAERVYRPYLTAVAPEQQVDVSENIGQLMLTLGFHW